jgi:hypothetical protein
MQIYLLQATLSYIRCSFTMTIYTMAGLDAGYAKKLIQKLVIE